MIFVDADALPNNVIISVANNLAINAITPLLFHPCHLLLKLSVPVD